MVVVTDVFILLLLFSTWSLLWLWLPSLSLLLLYSNLVLSFLLLHLNKVFAWFSPFSLRNVTPRWKLASKWHLQESVLTLALNRKILRSNCNRFIDELTKMYYIYYNNWNCTNNIKFIFHVFLFINALVREDFIFNSIIHFTPSWGPMKREYNSMLN